MIEKIYKNSIIEKPKFTLSVLIILLLSFGYFVKDFQLDASSDTLLLENDPDLKYLREVNSKYGTKDFLVLTYSHFPNDDYDFKSDNTIKNIGLLKNSLENLDWVDSVITILDIPRLAQASKTFMKSSCNLFFSEPLFFQNGDCIKQSPVRENILMLNS